MKYFTEVKPEKTRKLNVMKVFIYLLFLLLLLSCKKERCMECEIVKFQYNYVTYEGITTTRMQKFCGDDIDYWNGKTIIDEKNNVLTIENIKCNLK